MAALDMRGMGMPNFEALSEVLDLDAEELGSIFTEYMGQEQPDIESLAELLGITVDELNVAVQEAGGFPMGGCGGPGGQGRPSSQGDPGNGQEGPPPGE